MKKQLQYLLICTILLLGTALLSTTALAQPSPSQLADQVEQANNEYLRNIERVAITVEHDFIGSTTSYYTKDTVDGRAVLLPEDEDDSEIIGHMGFGTAETRRFITGASSITSENLNGRSVYKIFVDDPEVFEEMQMEEGFEQDFEDEEMDVKSATVWMGQDDYLVYKMEYVMENQEGTSFSMNIHMDDYDTFNGMPLAMTTRMEVEGWQDMMPEEDQAEAMAAMEEMMKELEDMPPAQRDMIMEQMGPQMEQYKRMMEGEESTVMTLTITNVLVNP